MPNYSFEHRPDGNVQVSRDGQIISTTTANQAGMLYGYQAPQSSSPGGSTSVLGTAGASAPGAGSTGAPAPQGGAAGGTSGAPGVPPGGAPSGSTPSGGTSTGTSLHDQIQQYTGASNEQIQSMLSGKGVDPASFAGLIDTMKNKVMSNNDLMKQRTALVNTLFGSGVTPETLATLPKDVQTVISRGNRREMELQLRVINDTVAGKNATMSQSIQALTTGYKEAQTNINSAVTQILNYAKSNNVSIETAARALGPIFGVGLTDEMLTNLKALGVPMMTTTQVPNFNMSGQPVSDVDMATKAIVGIESGGNYSAISQPLTSGEFTGHQSYGKYQVLDVHIPDWTLQAGFTGSAQNGGMTAQEFLGSQDAQDAVAKQQIGALWNKYGNIADVASVWFTGLPAAQSKGRSDPTTGMTSEQYITKATSSFNSSKSAAPSGAVDPTVQAYVNGLKNGTITSISSVPAAYRNAVARASDQQGIATPLADRRYIMAANGIIANFIDLPTYQLTANALPYILKIDAAMTIPGSISDQELLDSFTKLSTSGGVITDAQVKVITDGRSIADTVSVYGKKLAEGGVLSDSQRGELFKIAHQTFVNLKTGYQPIYDEAAKKLKASQIPEQFWTLPDLNALSKASEDAVRSSPNYPGGGSGASGSTTLMTGPDGIQYNVPNSQVEAFKAAGGH